MNPLNPFAISNLLIIITFVPLFVLLCINAKTKVVRVFASYIFCALAWGVCGFLWGVLRDIDALLRIWAITKIFVLFMTPFFYHSVILISKKQKQSSVIFWYLQAAIFSTLALMGYAWDGAIYVFDSFYYPKATMVYLLAFIFWLSGITCAHIELIKHYREVHPKERMQIQYLILLSIGFLGGATNFLPALGFTIYPYGNFLVPLHAFSITYAILRHQLFDIKVIIRKSLAYPLAIILLTLIYFYGVIVLEKGIKVYTGYHSENLSLFLVFVIGALFFPLHNQLQKLLDRLFFTKSLDDFELENRALRETVTQSEHNRTVATLASGIAHEIKNPLTALKTFIEYFPDKKNDPVFQEKFQKIASSEISRIEEILSELLEFAKPSPITLRDTNVPKVIEHALSLTGNQLQKSKVTVKTDFGPNLPLIKGDPNKLLQVFINLILNANDAMNNGGALIIHATSSESSLTISISDTGHGIPKEFLKQIFEPFYSTKETGTGLGLAIVKGIVEDHGGKISTDSALNTGTTFTLLFPIQGAKI